MCSTAAHLVDRIFPDVAVRQWVLSVPYELRLLLARRIDAFQALIRLFTREVLAWQQRVAKADGVTCSRGGGVTFPQRFGGSLNLNTHIHGVFPDGVFVRPSDAERARFVPLRAPTSVDLALLCERIAERFTRWLERNQLMRPGDGRDHGIGDDDPNEGERDPLTDCARLALSLGELGRAAPVLGAGGATAAEDRLLPRARKGKHVGEASGFSIHAGVAIAKGNAFGRELLFRYCARPPFSLERLSLLPDGRLAYELRHPWRRDETHRIMKPLELLARLAALIPPPRHPLIQFHGVFAPRSSWRTRVVPDGAPHEHTKACFPGTYDDATRATHPAPREPSPGAASAAAPPRSSPAASHPESKRDPRLAPSSAPAVTTSAEKLTAEDGSLGVDISASPAGHRGKRSWWIDWATLLRRVYAIDALACPCGGRVRFVEVVQERREALAHLERLGIDGTAPPVARARYPADFVDPPSPDC